MNTQAWRKVPFFRWSFLRMMLGFKHLVKEWQVGDGREEALAKYVIDRARSADAEDVIRVIDEFAYTRSFLINVGDEKGKILDEAVRRARPRRILELGTYCGYSSLRMAVAAPEARITTLEFNSANAAIARRIFEHAGVANRVDIVVGTLGDGGATMKKLADDYGFAEGTIDFLFIDHAHEAYLPDLRRILEKRWLRPGALVVADNIKFPGAPDYLAYMKESEGKLWRTTERWAHLEYQSVFKDLVLVSELLDSSRANGVT